MNPFRFRHVLNTPNSTVSTRPMAGKPCPECGNAIVIHKDGCDFCTSRGCVGQRG